MNSWYPKLNSKGSVISGSGAIWFRNSYKDNSGREIAGGWTPAFLDDDNIIFNNGSTVSTFNLKNGTRDDTTHAKESYSVIVAALNKYIGWLVGNIYYDGTYKDGVGPSISKTGKNFAWITPYQSEVRTLVINNKSLYYTGLINQLSVGDQGIVWTEFGENSSRIVRGILTSNPSVIETLTVRSWEESLLVDTPNGPWIISTFQDGIGARPFLSNVGQFFRGEFFIGDGLWLNSKIVIVGSDNAGQPLYYEIDPSILNVDLTKLDDMPVDYQAQIDALNNRVSTLETNDTNQKHQIAELQAEVSSLTTRVGNLESKPSTGVNNKLVTIKSSRGKYLRDDWDDSLGHFDRDSPGSGEQYTLESVGNPVNPPNPPVDNPLTTSGKFLQRGNQIIRVKRFTSFKLLNLFESNVDIQPILNEYSGYNSVRIFCYTPKKDWGNEAWDFPSNLVTLDFLRRMEDRGMDVELTLITDDDTSKIDKAKSLIDYLSKNPVNNLILEAVNEPYVHNPNDKIDPNELKNALSNSPYIYSSGVYTDNKKFYGKIWTRHSPRSSDWWRKGGHELMEAWNGGGPNFSDEPALRMPGIQDEPIKPSDTGFTSSDFYEYAASCGLMGAGATFHSESGKYSRPLSQEEISCKDKFLEGLNMYPLDAANGSYRKIEEPGNEPGGPTETSRTYVVGNYAIRIHQRGFEFPEDGWTSMDNTGVCWKR
jgi:hypothetical protein